jgi:uncharacterized damage-inducible protein DinB
MPISAQLIPEFKHEMAVARKMLERIPPSAFSWKPHEKSMTMGQLAAHLANIINKWLQAVLMEDELDLAAGFQRPKTDTVEEVLAVFDKAVKDAVQLLERQTDEHLLTKWTLKKEGQVVFELPRLAVIRSAVFNHIIHHRGQLSVYLRLQNVPLPPVYGPTADEG